MDSVEWLVSPDLVGYPDAVASMEERVEEIRLGNAAETVWLLQHPPLYTAGTSADSAELLDPARFPVYRSGRGGRYTYHGPGQRIAYVMIDLRKRGQDIRAYVRGLESWIISALKDLGVHGWTDPDRIGVWVDSETGSAKIAAIGVRIRRWITFHGISLNISPDLSHFDGIVPCGLAGYSVTSLRALGLEAKIEDVDTILKHCFHSAVLSTKSPLCARVCDRT